MTIRMSYIKIKRCVVIVVVVIEIIEQFKIVHMQYIIEKIIR